MRKGRIILAEFVAQRVERLFRATIARNDTECPVRHFLSAGKPFIRPGKQNRSGESAFRDALDVPAEHLGLFVLRMANRVHSELTENERTFLRQILQPQKVTLEIALIVEINVEAKEIDVLRQQILRRRKSRVGKQDIGIDGAPNAHEM